jgi:hypothetical protein
MAEIFGAPQPADGNGETPRVSLIQGVINEMDAANNHKQRAIDLLDDLKGWLIRSLERDVGFHMRLVQAITDNSPHIDTSLMETEIQKIASKYGNGDNAKS